MKKLVLKLDLHDDKAKQKAMKTLSNVSGVESIAMDMKEKKLTVMGDFDPVNVVGKLRKVWHTEIVSEEPAKGPEKKKEEPKREGPKKEDKKKYFYEHIKAHLAKAYEAYYNPLEEGNSCSGNVAPNVVMGESTSTASPPTGCPRSNPKAEIEIMGDITSAASPSMGSPRHNQEVEVGIICGNVIAPNVVMDDITSAPSTPSIGPPQSNPGVEEGNSCGKEVAPNVVTGDITSTASPPTGSPRSNPEVEIGIMGDITGAASTPSTGSPRHNPEVEVGISCGNVIAPNVMRGGFHNHIDEKVESSNANQTQFNSEILQVRERGTNVVVITGGTTERKMEGKGKGSDSTNPRIESKKAVLKLDLHDDKAKQKAMETVSSFSGIDSMAMDMEQKKLTLMGDVDTVNVVNELRKVWPTEIVSVGPAKVSEKKKEKPKREGPKKEDKKKDSNEHIKDLAKAYEAYYNSLEEGNSCGGKVAPNVVMGEITSTASPPTGCPQSNPKAEIEIMGDITSAASPSMGSPRHNPEVEVGIICGNVIAPNVVIDDITSAPSTSIGPPQSNPGVEEGNSCGKEVTPNVVTGDITSTASPPTGSRWINPEVEIEIMGDITSAASTPLTGSPRHNPEVEVGISCANIIAPNVMRGGFHNHTDDQDKQVQRSDANQTQFNSEIRQVRETGTNVLVISGGTTERKMEGRGQGSDSTNPRIESKPKSRHCRWFRCSCHCRCHIGDME